MNLHTLHRTHTLPVGLDEAWAFFSNPNNLSKITPPSLAMRLTCDVPDTVYAGMIITYRVVPLFGVAMDWVTEITHVIDKQMFVDEQRFGPYRFWHHQHLFREVAGGVAAEDIVHYMLPLGVVGQAVNAALVRRQLEDIFDYRRRVLDEQFGPKA